jgi:gentisate 1,2-dioxygenase
MSTAIKQDDGQSTMTSRAQYYHPENAFDWKWPDVPRHQFIEERDRAFDPATPTSLIPLDISEQLGLAYEATIPTILSRYVRLKAGESLATNLKASGEIHYVLTGSGVSVNGDDRVEWGEGDVFVFPGGQETTHSAGKGDAVLFQVTNEPLLNFEGLRAPAPGEAVIEAVHYPASEIDTQFENVFARSVDAEQSGRAVLFSSPAMGDARNTIPMINTAINTLDPGKDQKPHRHNGAAITLAIMGEGIHSMIEDEEVPWATGAAQITPAAELHSHHNRGNQRMRSFVVQDEGLHWYMRTPGFSWT